MRSPDTRNDSQTITDILKREGVHQGFCFPFTLIIEALADAGIRPIVARQEPVTENMADDFRVPRPEGASG